LTRYPELSAFVRDRVVSRGNYLLASGQRSSYYFDGKQASMDPWGSALIANAILLEIETIEVDALGGPDLGAAPIAGAIAICSGIPTFVVRKNAKQHGTKKRIEGPELHRNARVAIVDDVVTTGNSILSAIDAVQELGCEITLAISVVDREAGASESLRERGIRYQPLVTFSELGIKDEINRLRNRLARYDQVIGDDVLPITEKLGSYDTFLESLWSNLPEGPAKDALEQRREAAKKVHDALCSLYESQDEKECE